MYCGAPRSILVSSYVHFFSNPSIVHGGLIVGLEARVSSIEEKLSDLDARGSEERDNLANERNLDRFVMSGKSLLMLLLKVLDL